MAIDPITLSIVTGLAASAVYGGIQVAARKLSRAVTDEEKSELETVYRNAFMKAFAQTLAGLDDDLRSHVGDILKEFVTDESVSEQMIAMALIGREPDTSVMNQWFHKKEYDLSTLPINPDEAVQSLIINVAEELQHAAGKSGSKLHNLVSIGLLKQVIAHQRAAARDPDIFEVSHRHCGGLIAHSLEQPIARDDLLDQLYQFAVSGNGVVIGQPGVGKSYLLHKLSQRLIDRGHACICISVAGKQSRADLKTVFGINVDLVDYLRSTIPHLDGDMGVVLIDGYDAARSTETRTFFRDLIAQIIRELHPHWRIVVSVRTYDARKSNVLLDLFPSESSTSVPGKYQVKDVRCRHFAIPLLTAEEVQYAASKIDGLSAIYANSSEDFRELLRFPFNLWLVEKLLKDKPSLPELSAITSETELLSLYWERRVEDNELAHQMVNLLTVVTRNMVEQLNLVARRETVSAFPQFSQVVDELLSIEMLRYSSALRQSFEFSHNILFDYAVARLLIADKPDDFIEFFETDYFKPIFLLPSIEFYFSYLWLNQPDLFWQVFWRIYSSDAPVHLKLFARLIPPRIIVAQLESVEQLIPLAEALTSSYPNSPIAVAATLRMLLARGVKKPAIWSGFLNSIAHAVAREFIVDFAKVTDELIRMSKDEANDFILDQCGFIARSLAEWIFTERDSSTRNWLDRIGSQLVLPLVAKTFNTDSSASRLLIERIIKLTRDRAVPLEYLSRLVDVFDEIVVHDPELIAEIYELVFLSGELGDGAPFVGGIVVQLVVSAQSEREMLEHKLVWYYPRFLGFRPALATAVGMRCINFLVVRDHVINNLREGLTVKDAAQGIRFRGKEAVFLRDGNYVWTSMRTPHDHEPMHMVEDMVSHIAHLASHNKLDETNLTVLLDLFRDHAQVAYLWARLLDIGARYPEIFAEPLFELITNDPILYGDDTVYQLGEFLEVAPQYYSSEQMRILEEAIISKPRNENEPRRREVFEHRRNRLIARIPRDKLVTDEAKRLREQLDASRELYENQPLVSFFSFSEPYDEDKALMEQGIDLQAEANQQMRKLYTPLKEFKERWNNQTPDSNAVEAVLPAVRELYSILIEGALAPDVEVIDLAWTYLGGCVERMCHSLQENAVHFDFYKEIMIACANHHLPEPDTEHDAQYNFPSWSPSPRTSAAQGLLTLAYHHQADQDVLTSIQSLLRDPVPSVRYLVAYRLFLTYRLASEFFWHSVREIAESETNPVVLRAMYGSITVRGVMETQTAQDLLNETVNKLLTTEPDGELIEQIITILPWYMFVAQAEWALQVSSQIVGNPVQYAKVFAKLTFRALDPIKPDMLFSEGGSPISQRALRWVKDAIEAARAGIVEMLHNVLENGWTDDVRTDLQNLQRVIDDVVNRIYFAADIRDITGIPSDERRLSDDERREFYFAVKGILFQLSQLALDDTLGVIPAHTAHHFMQLMNGMLKYDPVDVLQMSTNIAKSSKASGYQFDSMAVREVIKLVETLLTDHQDKLRDNSTLANLLELLDIFAEAGWSEALDLVGRLSEIAR